MSNLRKVVTKGDWTIILVIEKDASSDEHYVRIIATKGDEDVVIERRSLKSIEFAGFSAAEFMELATTEYILALLFKIANDFLDDCATLIEV